MKTLKYIFTLSIALVFLTHCSKENDLSFIDKVVAPSNVSALFQITQDNTGLVTITPNAIGASNYNIKYGDDSSELVNVLQGESTSHVYNEGTYSVSVEAIGLTGLKSETTKDLVVSFKAPENLVVPIENDITVSKKVNVSATADFGVSFEVYFGEPGSDDPVLGNMGDTVSFTYAEAGIYTIRVVAMSAAIETVEYTEEFVVTEILQPINSAPAPPLREETDVISIFSSKYTDVPGTNYFPDWGQGGQGSGWALFDLDGDKMLQYTNLSYQGIALADGTSVDVSGMKYLHLDVWTADEGLKLETSLINDPTPDQATEAPVTKDLTNGEWTPLDILISDYTDQGLTVTEIFQMKFVGEPWATGTVFIDNIYFWKPSLVADTPEVPAPTPTITEGNVVSLFSDIYTNIGLNEINPDWGQTTTLTPLDIEGNNIWLYENLNYSGIVSNYDNPTDLSGMNYVHFDYFTPDATVLGLKMVNTVVDQEDIEFVAEIIRGTWATVTIPLSDFDLDVSAITQFIWDTDGESAKVYIDNFYFSSESGAQPTVFAPVPTIAQADVISIYSDSYTGVALSEVNPDWGQTTILSDFPIAGNNIWKYDLLNYSGIVTNYDNATDLSGMRYLHFDYFTPDATALGLKLVNTTLDPVQEDIEFLSTVKQGTWISVTIPLSNFDLDRSGITQLVWDTAGASATVYIDNLYFHN